MYKQTGLLQRNTCLSAEIGKLDEMFPEQNASQTACPPQQLYT